MSARHVLRAAGACTLATMLVLLAPGTAAAQSCLVELTGTDDAVRFDGMAPGDARAWWTGVANTSGDDVALSVRLTGDGALAAALDLAVHGCDEEWRSAGGTITCPGTAEQLLAPTELDDLADRALDLGTLPDGSVRHLRFTAVMRLDAGDEFQAATGRALATFTASGDGGTCAVPEPDDEDDDGSDEGDEGDDERSPSGPPTAPPTTPTTTALPQRDGGPPSPAEDPSAPRSGPREPRGPRSPGPLVVTGGEVVGPLMVGLALVGAGALADLCRRRRNRDPRRRGS